MSTGLRVVGELFRPEENSEGIYFKNIRLMTPHKTHLYVDSNSWKGHGLQEDREFQK